MLGSLRFRRPRELSADSPGLARQEISTPDRVDRDDSNHRLVLTFDDGPHHEYTPFLLDVLSAERVKAVFFICGKHAATAFGRQIIKRATSEGHAIGNHAYSHRRLTTLSPRDVRLEIQRTHDVIAEFEPLPKLFRPPYGSNDAIVRGIVLELGYRLVLWDVDSEDWKRTRQPDQWIDVASHGIGQRRRQTILLFHDKCGTTVENFGLFLCRMRTARPGLTFVNTIGAP